MHRFGPLTRLLMACALLGLLSCTARNSAPVSQRVTTFAQLPDWNGIWVAEGMDADVSGYPAENGPGWNMQLLGRSAPWNAATAQQFAASLRSMLAADATRRAMGWGYPAMMDGPPPLQFLITPEETLVINMYRDVRHVYTDGRPHPAAQDLWPTPWGDSVGRWEGDTLVIDTVAVKRPSVIPFLPPMLTERAHYVERLRKTGADRIESQLTIEDPQTLAKPWVIKVAYQRATTIDRLIHDSFDNDRSEVEGGSLTIAPPKRP
jgi:hypothetical protein